VLALRYRWWMVVAAIAIVASLAFVTCQAVASRALVTTYADGPGPSRLRVLFIGNSLTYVNSMPGIVAGMVRSRHPELAPRLVMVAAAGYSLEEHNAKGRAAELLRENRWDVVVIQERGGYAIDHPAETRQYAGLLAGAARRAGAVPLLMVDWFQASSSEPPGAAITAIATRLGVRTLPVGPALARIHHDLPDVELIVSDGQHPSRSGSYAIACIAYATILHESPEGLPTRFDLVEPDGREQVGGGLDAVTGRRLQADVWQAIASSPPTDWRPQSRAGSRRQVALRTSPPRRWSGSLPRSAFRDSAQGKVAKRSFAQ
jgi:hypothetical protein